MATLADLNLTGEQMAARYDCGFLAIFLKRTRCPWCSWRGKYPLVGLTPEGAPVFSADWVGHAWETHGPLYLGFVDAFSELAFRQTREGNAFAEHWASMDVLRRLVSRPGYAGLEALA